MFGMAAHGITDLVLRYEAAGRTLADLKTALAEIGGVVGTCAEDAEALGRKVVARVVVEVDRAEAAHRARAAAADGTAAYRRTKAGEWVAYAPAAVLSAGCEVTVTRADGVTTTRTVARVGRPFCVGGVEMAYGYLAAEQPMTAQPRSGRCDQCNGYADPLIPATDLSGIGGHVCRSCAREGFLSFA